MGWFTILRHVQANDELQHAELDVDDRCSVVIDMLARTKAGLVSHLAFSMKLQSSTTLHWLDSILDNGCLASNIPTGTKKNEYFDFTTEKKLQENLILYDGPFERCIFHIFLFS